MKDKKPKPAQTFPVLDGGGPAPRADQIAGIVERVWADSHVYHEDVKSLLTEWLGAEGCVVNDAEFAMLLSKANGEFARLATSEGDEGPRCPVNSLVECLYWDVQRLERGGLPEGAR